MIHGYKDLSYEKTLKSTLFQLFLVTQILTNPGEATLEGTIKGQKRLMEDYKIINRI